MKDQKEAKKGWALIILSVVAALKLVLAGFDIQLPLEHIDSLINAILGLFSIFSAWRFNFVHEAGKSAFRMLENSNLDHMFKKMKEGDDK